MNRRVIGSILMILGTSIGAGMLALPVVTATETFSVTAIGLLVAWLIMTVGALSILEVNLWLKPGTNFISMAGATLGKVGQVVTWIVYLLLLYSLICAYLSGLSDLLQALLSSVHLHIPRWCATLLSLSVFGWVVYRGVGSIDVVNRGLMSTKLVIFVILVSLVVSHVKLSNVVVGDYQFHIGTFMVMLTSFGFATIIPSLRGYLDSHRRNLIKVVIIGSLLPLVLYLIWVLVIQGVLPRTGAQGLMTMMTSSNTNSELMRQISHIVSNSAYAEMAKFFISICAMTSFLGVSLCLTDFIADGIKIHKKGRSALVVFAITYLPPLVIVLFWPGIFIHALAYAGLCCLVLLIIIPLLMLLVGRYHQHRRNKKILPGGIPLITLVLLAIVALLTYQLVI